MTIAVTGATGQLGRLVLQQLRAAAPNDLLIALARSPSKAAELGLLVREADYSKPQTLPAALAGVDKLLLISSSEVGQRATQHRHVIEAARQAGVQHVVYTSLLHADSSPLGLADEHRATEAALVTSGLPFTILRHGWYTENYTGAIPAALASGEFLGSAGQGRISSATRADFADAAVTVLTGAGHEGHTYELAGDASYTLADLAAEVSRQTGKPIAYRDLPEAEYAATLAGFGLPEGLAHAIAGWDAGAAQQALFDEGRQLSRLIGRPTTPLAITVADTLK